MSGAFYQGKFVAYNEQGEELPDPEPVEVPVEFRAPPSLVQEIQRYVRMEMSEQARRQGMETLDEADDFEVEGDLEESATDYELAAMDEDDLMRSISAVSHVPLAEARKMAREENERRRVERGREDVQGSDGDDVGEPAAAGRESGDPGGRGGAEKRKRKGGGRNSEASSDEA